MKLILPLLAISLAVVAIYYSQQPEINLNGELDLDSQFFSFIQEHGKSYKTAQEIKIRFEMFKKNLGEITRIIKSQELDYDIGLNYMADYTPEEYKRLLGYKSMKKENSPVKKLQNKGQIIYDHIDWNAK